MMASNENDSRQKVNRVSRIFQALFLSFLALAIYFEMTAILYRANLSSIDPFVTVPLGDKSSQYTLDIYLNKNFLCNNNNSCHDILDDRIEGVMSIEKTKIFILGFIIVHAIIFRKISILDKVLNKACYILMIILYTIYGSLNIAVDSLFQSYCDICKDVYTKPTALATSQPIGWIFLTSSLVLILTFILFYCEECRQSRIPRFYNAL